MVDPPAHTPRTRSAMAFLTLTLGLALPVWLAGDRLGVIVGLRVPASDLVLAFVPMAAALILVTAREGWREAARLLARAFDPRSLRDPRWVVTAVLLAPAIYGATWLAVTLAGRSGDLAAFDPVRMTVLFALFFLLAAGEEIGWMGFLIDPLQKRWGALGASLLLAIPWWLGHLPSMQAIGATSSDIAWWALGAAALRIVFTWLYNNTQASLFAAVLFHALLNLSRIASYPAEGAHYDSAYQTAGYVVVGALAAILVLNSRAATLTR